MSLHYYLQSILHEPKVLKLNLKPLVVYLSEDFINSPTLNENNYVSYPIGYRYSKMTQFAIVYLLCSRTSYHLTVSVGPAVGD